jgi:hypothetical protein
MEVTSLNLSSSSSADMSKNKIKSNQFFCTR